ncbi:aldo/keto reductase [Desulfofarcimen acetoxidans DSM 771]|uniref:Aldo/keto reductase n=1 Tax=Desulfofarcimen acetoxidans (strain ATCC 49208 / DSM 771 / KCTC 5769 / VKM B-1644 / 5575) TaxID=485916 RepID=C8W1S3_DESAS|nr:aldo/keto reductase [Desulfofarcimen acetoxidans]ACV63544.1 aldo/keto reductase [Desulfofarcimen acetoxidans DSM 771]
MMQKNNMDFIVPKRAFGNTGVKISKLCLGGGSFGSADSQALLDEALKYGVDCWEIVSFTGKVYAKYFQGKPEIRERVFLSGKVYSTDPVVMQKQLDKVLKENETSFIDFLAIHSVDDIKMLNNDVRKWVEKVKKEKKIRFFGFCTHKNMDNCLSGASELGWIDGIQTFYNYRMQSIKSMEEALQKCHGKGIGIFAVKSMGFCVQKKAELQKLPSKEKIDSLLTGHNISFEQSKLRAIWQNPSLTSICSLMPNSAILQSNVLAAIDKNPLNPEILRLLLDYANATGKYFCRRCGACETTNTDKIPIFDIMEMLMYSRGYGRQDLAAQRFAQMPSGIQSKIDSSDYSIAEKICPQKMPITRLMKEAYLELQKE